MLTRRSRILRCWKWAGGVFLGFLVSAAHPEAAWALTQATLTESNAQGSPWSFVVGAPAPATIPTLSQWGLVIFALLIAVLAFKYLRRHRGPAGAALIFVVLWWTRMVLGSAGWPLVTASHEPSASITGTTSTLTMRSPLNPTAGQGSVFIAAQLAPVNGDNVTGMTLHYQKNGDGSIWRTAPGSRWGAPTCSNCWAASLPLGGYAANDQLHYYLSVATGAGGTAYLSSSNGQCTGVTCGAPSTCVDGSCRCNSNWAGPSCSTCASGYYGIACALCTSCGPHGSCLDGLAGNGTCGCDSNWAGGRCAACASSYYGAACTPCPDCGPHGTCVDGLAGDGSCSCEANYCGADCSTVIDPCVGVTCGAHSTCVGGSCVCAGNWTGGSCATCAPGYYGAACAPCPSCGAHGTCLDGLSGDGTCSCDESYTSSDCTSCLYMHLPNGDCVDNCTVDYPYVFGAECVDVCPVGWVVSIGNFCVSDQGDDVIPSGPPNQ